MSRPFSLSSSVRALGSVVATGLHRDIRSRTILRAAALAAADVGARRIDRRGITLLSITPDEGTTFTPLKRIGSEALTVSAWAGAGLLLTVVTDRLPLPCAAKALAVGAVVYGLDVYSAQLYATLLLKAEEAKEQAAAAAVQAREATADGGSPG